MWILSNKCQHIQRKTPLPSLFKTLLFFLFLLHCQCTKFRLYITGTKITSICKISLRSIFRKIKLPKKDIYTLSRNRHYTARLLRPSLLKSWHFIQEIHAFRSIYGLNMMFQLHCTESLLLSKLPRHTSPHTGTNKNNLLYPLASCFWC